MKENETLADIVKEMREWSEDENDALSRYADRIEAAAERERTAHVNDIHDALYKATGIPGNVAALREAMERIVNCVLSIIGSQHVEIIKFGLEEIKRISRAALAAAARNADRFATVGAAHKAWRATKQERDFADWLFAPAEGGKE